MGLLRIKFCKRFFGRLVLLLVAVNFFASNIVHASAHDHSLFNELPGSEHVLKNTSHDDVDLESRLADARHCHGCFLSVLPQLAEIPPQVSVSTLSYEIFSSNASFSEPSFDSPPPK
jgi:hypothetical protein